MRQSSHSRQFKVLLTAQEAYPALEHAFLEAEREISAGFRIFDPNTALRSPEARAIGTTWSDLIAHTLDRGVAITLVVSDFDPVARPALHRYVWDCARATEAAGEASRHPELLTLRAAMHPARVGLLPRLILWRRLYKEVKAILAEVNDRPASERRAYLARTPGLVPLARWQGDRAVPRIVPPAPLVPATHHQKLAVFDRKTLYIGGLDLNERRYDTPEHDQDADETWHDTQVLVDGPAAEEAARHLDSFEAESMGRKTVPHAHLFRTISAKRAFDLPFLSPRPVVNELADQHHAQVAQSRHLIYFETQFFRDRKLARRLARRARDVPDLSLILILPAAPEEAAFDNSSSSDIAYGEYLQAQALDIIRDAFGDRLFIGAPAQPCFEATGTRDTLHHAPIVYLHAKVSIFDNRIGIVSSANLNGRSMEWDTEAGITTQSDSEVTHLKNRCFAHWLGADAGPEFYDIRTARAAWAQRAEDNMRLHPDHRRGFLLPFATEPGAELGYNLPGVPEEMA